MKFFAAVLIYLLLFSLTIFSQFEVQSDPLTQKASRDIWVARNEQMRVDILRDINSLKPKDQTYFWLGEQNEALNTFERFIDIQNQLSSHFTYTAKNGEVYTYHFYDSIPGEFLDANFEGIYRNTERIESVKVRLRIRLNILRNNLMVNGSFGSMGMIQIS